MTKSLPSLPATPEQWIRGAFSVQVKSKVGTGGTSRTISQQILVYIEQVEEDRFSLQQLNANMVPSGQTRFISREDLLSHYLPEPALYMEKVYPILRRLSTTLDQADKHYAKGENFSAEYEYKNALRIDEDNIRATFGLGLTYLSRADAKKGELVFRRLVRLRAAFEEKHKHLFNDFGIKLRKNKLLSQALKFYSRAYQVSKNDENLLYNIARTLYEKGNFKAALRFLDKALALNPYFEEGLSFQEALSKKLAQGKGKRRTQRK